MNSARNFNTFIALFVAALCLQGCSYAISPDVADSADKKPSFSKLLADPASFQGKLIILGGTIEQITNLKQGTLIEITQKRLDYWGKPEHTRRTGGRFYAFHPGSLDALIYSPGRDVTIAGEVLGPDSPMPGNRSDDYPVLRVKEIKLWARETQSWDKPQWIDPLYDPDYHDRRN